MSYQKNQLIKSIILLLTFVNFLIIADINFIYLRELLTLFTIFFIPGFLTLILFNQLRSSQSLFVYSLGLSLAYQIIIGLIINSVFPLIIQTPPLSLNVLLPVFDLLVLTLCLLVVRNHDNPTFRIDLKINLELNSFIYILPPIILALGIAGTIVLNNHGTNLLLMLTIIAMALYVLFIMKYKIFAIGLHLYSIYTLSLTILLLYSLRSFHVSGWDIFIEYDVFQLTKQSLLWDIAHLRNTYNACLSITILPTIIDQFLNINDEFIFKLVYPILFSFAPVSLYLIYSKFLNPRLSFLGSFLFLSTYNFMFEISILVRQQIALLFFALMILILFEKQTTRVHKNILFIIFGIAMILSHYSTTYIALVVFLVTYILQAVYIKISNQLSLTGGKLENIKCNETHHLNLVPIIILYFVAYIWYFQVTDTSHGLVNTIKESVTNVRSMLDEDLITVQGSPIDQFNIFYKPNALNNIALVEKHNLEVIDQISRKKGADNLYTERFDYSQRILVNPEGRASNIPSPYHGYIIVFFESVKKLIKVFLVIGTIYIVISKKYGFGIEYRLFSLVFIVLFFLMTVMPILSLSYPIGRFYIQTLVILSITTIVGGELIIGYGYKVHSYMITLEIILILFFLINSGFLYQIIGGTVPSALLNNTGTNYDEFYTFTSDKVSILWLKNNLDHKSSINSDSMSKLRLRAYGQLNNNVVEYIFPEIIDKTSYVYSSSINTLKNKYHEIYKDRRILYKYPTDFLYQNKNTIYNNGKSLIFK
ncbi:DUF2206 domain-containing protein [candidate division WWE3 bacterium]|uniref:DUF2206 domain-containing protein n=1 Tax=candidate division WWE3 bacterium TaxID=2053526 RepID=A0A3A4ZGZ6_UNCKA|nr:MAG: DUF2206 domain-containing protein [candidate division WWE3 bacterium]